MLRAFAELAVYGTFAVLLTVASLWPEGTAASSSADGVPAPTVSGGEQLFRTKGCIGCHTLAGIAGTQMQVGPDLTALASRAGSRVEGLSAEAYVRQSLRTPGAFIVPGYTQIAMPDLHLSDPEVDALVAFLLR